MIDTRGVIYKGRKEGMNEYKERHAVETEDRTLEDAIKGADVFIGVSSKDLLTNEMLETMNPQPVIFGEILNLYSCKYLIIRIRSRPHKPDT